MPLDALNDLLEDETGGVFFMLPSPEVQLVARDNRKYALEALRIEGRNIARKEQLLNHVATALRFPGYFGGNWDALEECLTDMEWVDAPGYVIYYDHIDAAARGPPGPVRHLRGNLPRRGGLVEGGRHADGGAALRHEGPEGRGEAQGRVPGMRDSSAIARVVTFARQAITSSPAATASRSVAP